MGQSEAIVCLFVFICSSSSLFPKVCISKQHDFEHTLQYIITTLGSITIHNNSLYIFENAHHYENTPIQVYR